MARRCFFENTIRNEHGTVTIYLVIVFIVLLMFIGLFVDLARIKIAQNQLRRAINAAARSVLADYNTSLKNDYGLFVVRNKSTEQYNQDFVRYASANLARSNNDNFTLLDFRLENGSLALAEPLSDTSVLEQQILEQMKYIAPIEITKSLVEKLKPLGEMADDYKNQKDAGTGVDDTNPKFEKIRDLNRQIDSIEQQIKQLRQSGQDHSQEIAQLEAEIKAIKAEIKKLRDEIQKDVIRTPDEPSLKELRNQEANYKNRFLKNFGPNGIFSFITRSAADDMENNEATDQYTVDNEQTIDNLVGLLDFEKNLLKVRNDLYMNEYVLTYFNTLVDELADGNQANMECEAEYVLYGPGNGLLSPQAKAVQQLYGTRFALDFLAYFVFSKEAPPDFILRAIYALIRGALQASIDTYKLLSDPANTVGIVEMGPGLGNPVGSRIGLNYYDHIRLFMFLDALGQGANGKNAKLGRIMHLIQRKNNLDASQAYTLLDGNAEVSIKLWFIPLSGFSNLSRGPFGTEIRQGRVYIKKSVELNY